MRAGTREDAGKGNGMIPKVRPLVGIETEAEMCIGGGAMIVKRKTAHDGNGDDRGHPRTDCTRANTVKSKSVGYLGGETIKIVDIEGAGHTLGCLRDRDHDHHNMKGTEIIADRKTRLAPQVQSRNTSPLTPKTTDTPPDDPPPQHPTPTPSKPSSVPFHPLPNLSYAPKAAAPTKQTTRASSRASPPLTTPPPTCAQIPMQKIGVML